MPDLILHNAEPELIASLHERAASLGISMEEAHRMLLRRALDREKNAPTPEAHNPYTGMDFKEFLRAMPYDGPDDIFERHKDKPRDVNFD